MTIAQFPARGPKRIDTLKAALRPVDTGTMTTLEVIALCESVLPDATADEMIQALEEVSDEHQRESMMLEELRRIAAPGFAAGCKTFGQAIAYSGMTAEEANDLAKRRVDERLGR